ncbi:MAG: type III pantothenate kinase [Clostridiales bacterium]|nr:type III pantothenate kinase [Clostridiales bacterium]
MVLAIDIGNTNIVIGGINHRQICFIERLSTVRTKTELEYAVDIQMVLDVHHVSKKEIEGCIISSVVPQITNVARLAAKKILEVEAIVLGPGVRTGLNIMMDNPASLGADLVADAVAGIAEYPAPLIIFDMGTATTASVVDERKHYVGGMIFPGLRISLDALTAHASQLSGISLDPPRNIIGRNTIDCMKSGVLYSTAASMDGIVDRIEEELGQKTTVIATGGLAKNVVPHCRKKIILDENLLLKGLFIIYEKNTRHSGNPPAPAL